MADFCVAVWIVRWVLLAPAGVDFKRLGTISGLCSTFLLTALPALTGPVVVILKKKKHQCNASWPPNRNNPAWYSLAGYWSCSQFPKSLLESHCSILRFLTVPPTPPQEPRCSWLLPASSSSLTSLLGWGGWRSRDSIHSCQHGGWPNMRPFSSAGCLEARRNMMCLTNWQTWLSRTSQLERCQGNRSASLSSVRVSLI